MTDQAATSSATSQRPTLATSRVNATLPAQDLERAQRFYSERLGLEPSEKGVGGLFYDVGDGTRFFLFQTSGMPSGQHTQMGFRVTDIDTVVADLQGRGVQFEEYDLPGLKTINGVATRDGVSSAWFKDSEGNLLGIVEID